MAFQTAIIADLKATQCNTRVNTKTGFKALNSNKTCAAMQAIRDAVEGSQDA